MTDTKKIPQFRFDGDLIDRPECHSDLLSDLLSGQNNGSGIYKTLA